jgi:hypothetical protein
MSINKTIYIEAYFKYVAGKDLFYGFGAKKSKIRKSYFIIQTHQFEIAQMLFYKKNLYNYSKTKQYFFNDLETDLQ